MTMAAPEHAAAVNSHADRFEPPRVALNTASAVQNAWQAKQAMKYVNARHASDVRASCCNSVRRVSFSVSGNGGLAACGE